MDWNEYFKMMIDWKKLPAYRAEPRIDSLIGYYLKDILSSMLGDEITGIIPEFPLRKGTVKSKLKTNEYPDSSYKVDFFCIGSKRINYLVEFKTDGKSLRPEQDKYLLSAEDIGTEQIIKGVFQILEATSNQYVKKYKWLIAKMQKLGLLDESQQYSGLNPELKKIYVIPFNEVKSPDIVDFKDIVEWFEKKPNKDTFELELMKTLQIWHDEEANQ